MKLRSFRSSLSSIALAMVLLSAGGASAAAIETPDEASDLLPETAGTTNTKCDTALTICATSIAIASSVCTQVAYRTMQCTGAATVGGQGTSPLALPGRVDYDGNGQATYVSHGDSCINSYRSGYGSATWGAVNTNGAGAQQTLSLCTQVYFYAFGGCLTMTSRAQADATARTVYGGVSLTSVKAPQSVHSATKSSCV